MVVRVLWIGALWAGCAGDGPGSLDTPPPEETVGVDWPEAWIALEAEVLRLVNIERGGLNACGGVSQPSQPPLALDPDLTPIARAHSEDMAERGFFEHTNPDGLDVADRLEEAAYAGAYPWGENIASGYPSAREVVDGWMLSPGHCLNMLSGEFGVIGIGYYGEGTGAPLWTQVFAGPR